MQAFKLPNAQRQKLSNDVRLALISLRCQALNVVALLRREQDRGDHFSLALREGAAAGWGTVNICCHSNTINRLKNPRQQPSAI
jgi:hypothetical protein